MTTSSWSHSSAGAPHEHLAPGGRADERRSQPVPPRLRIGIVVPGFHRYPEEPFVPYWGDFVARLARRADVTVFALRRPQTPFQFHGAAVVPIGAGDPRLWGSPRLWLRAVRLIASETRSRGLAVLHALHANEAGMVAGLAAARAGVPCLIHVGGGEFANLADIGYGAATVPAERCAVSLALSLASGVTAGSLAMTATVAAHPTVARRALSVIRIPFAVDPDRFAPATSNSAPAFAHVADMNPVKDQECLITALALLVRDRPDVRLHWVGDGVRYAALRALARALDVDHSIRWWGRVPHDVVPEVYGRSTAFVLSSRHEAQGVVLAEAACSGLPVASTAVGIAPELPEAGTHLSRTRDPQGLATAMHRALETGDAARHRLRAGAMTRFGPDTVDRRLDALYRRVAEGRTNAGSRTPRSHGTTRD